MSDILYIHFLGRYCNQFVIHTLNHAICTPFPPPFLPLSSLSILLQNSTPMQCLLAHNAAAILDSSREESSSLTRPPGSRDWSYSTHWPAGKSYPRSTNSLRDMLRMRSFFNRIALFIRNSACDIEFMFFFFFFTSCYIMEIKCIYYSVSNKQKK